jgi:undecaprenyl-diphosphatase
MQFTNLYDSRVLEAIFLGIIQGLTEFLPISSSAHIRIIGEFLPSASDPGATFTAIIQIGTELAVILYFRREIIAILRASLSALSRREHDASQARLGLFIVIGSIPIVVFGVFLQEIIRREFRSLTLIASVLIGFAFVLWIADRYGKKDRTLSQIQLRDGILVGLAQALALIPGVSRSGATIAMCRILGLDRVSALKYSFLLAIPAVLGSGFFELANSITEPGLSEFSGFETGVATVTSFLMGYLVIAWLMRFVTTRTFTPFVIYRIALGLLVFGLLASGIFSS